LNESKTLDKKFIMEDLDPTHLLVKETAREEIMRKVEEWMDAVSFELCVVCSLICFTMSS
jgi:Transcription factor TFIIH complex subunit Tfb5.